MKYAVWRNGRPRYDFAWSWELQDDEDVGFLIVDPEDPELDRVIGTRMTKIGAIIAARRALRRALTGH
jgi:hypothetical protein